MSANDPDAEVIDADLRLYGYNPDERYPEYSHSDLRQAWLAGYDDARAAVADRDARLAAVAALAEDWERRGEYGDASLTDGARTIRAVLDDDPAEVVAGIKAEAEGVRGVIRAAVVGHLPQSVGHGHWPRCFSHPAPVDYTPDHVTDVVMSALSPFLRAEVVAGGDEG